MHTKIKVCKLILIGIILLLSSTRNSSIQAQGQSPEDFSKLDPHTRISNTGKLLPPSRSIPSDVIARLNTNRPDDSYNPVILSSRASTGSPFGQNLFSSEDQVSPNYIVGPDNRTQSNTNNYPDRAVVHITGDQIGHCTGWLYDDDTVATAAHCIHTGGQWVTGIIVIPGRNGSQSAPYGTCRAHSSHTVIGWITTGFPEYDYGAIKLDCRIGNTVGWFGITNQQTGSTPTTTNSYRGCINKLLRLLDLTAFYGNSSSMARIYIISSQNTSIPNDVERGIMVPINCSTRTHVRGH